MTGTHDGLIKLGSPASHARNQGVKTVNHGEISSINITAWLARLFENNEKRGAFGPFFISREEFVSF